MLEVVFYVIREAMLLIFKINTVSHKPKLGYLNLYFLQMIRGIVQ